MRLEEALYQIEKKLEGGLKKRLACSHCGNTWVEIVGLFAGNIGGQDQTYLSFGQESEVCQNCKFRIRACPACGSNDSYEIDFSKETQNTPLSFERIRTINRT